MARRRNAARSIFHTAVGPERRVVETPDIEPRAASRADYAHWGEDADAMWWQEEGRFPEEPSEPDDDAYDDYGYEDEEDEEDEAPKSRPFFHGTRRDRELAEREAAILKAMAKATLPEQREMLAELNGIRAEKTARIAASRELDLANATVADHLTPIVSMGSRSTAKSDWLDDVPALAPRDMSHDMIVEAAMFWRDTHVAVKADAQELVEQAKGRARVVASRFEAQAPAARRIFMEEIVRLAAAHPAQEPAADGVAKSTLPVAVNPSDAPETFDTNTLSAEDREALHDSQMADSDFAQKYQSSRVIAAINETMWARLAGFETEDDEGYDAKEKQRQSETDDTKDEGAAEDTSGDEKKKNPFGKADDTDESDDSGGTETPVKGEVDDSGKPWEKKDASRRTAAEGRSLSEIAREIRGDWKNVYFGAVPYLEAMESLDSIHDTFGADDAASIVGYFLSNATTWRGETAKRVKAELKGMWKQVYGSKTAGAPTIMGPDQDLKNAPKAEQDAYWNWVGQMAADSDSGYYVPLSFRSWRSSYWSDEKGAPTYSPGMPPMASSRRTATGQNGYVCMWKGKRVEVYANTTYEAQQIAAKELGAKKTYEVSVTLAEKDGAPYVNDTATLGARRTAADEPAKDGAAESTLPVAINPSDAPEGLDQLNENPQPATGMVGEGSGPAPQGAAAGGPTTFNDFVKDHTKAAAFRARVQANLARTR